MLFDKGEEAEIEAGIVYQYHHIWLVGQYVFFAEANIAEYGRQVLHHLYESHESKVSDMLYYMAAGCCHTVTAPAADVCSRVFCAQGLDQVRPVQVTRCFAGYDVVFHVGKIAFYLPCSEKPAAHDTQHDRYGYDDRSQYHAPSGIEVVLIDKEVEHAQVQHAAYAHVADQHRGIAHRVQDSLKGDDARLPLTKEVRADRDHIHNKNASKRHDQSEHDTEPGAVPLIDSRMGG